MGVGMTFDGIGLQDGAIGQQGGGQGGGQQGVLQHPLQQGLPHGLQPKCPGLHPSQLIVLSLLMPLLLLSVDVVPAIFAW